VACALQKLLHVGPFELEQSLKKQKPLRMSGFFIERVVSYHTAKESIGTGALCSVYLNYSQLVFCV
jgi:hypothetical protein